MHKKYNMKQIWIIIVGCLLFFPLSQVSSQTTIDLKEVAVVASRTTNNAEGYSTNLRGSKLTKGKNSEETLKLLPSISFENGTFKINGLPVGDVFLNGSKLRDVSELKNIPGEMIDKVVVKYLEEGEQRESLSGGAIYIQLHRPAENGYYGNVQTSCDWQKSSGWGNESIGGLINGRVNNLSIYDNFSLEKIKYKSIIQQITHDETGDYVIEDRERNHGTRFKNHLSLTRQFVSGTTVGASYFLSTNKSFPSSSTPLKEINGDANTVAQEGTIKSVVPIKTLKGKWEIIADYYNRTSKQNKQYMNNNSNVGVSDEKNDLNLWKFTSVLAHQIPRMSMMGKYGIAVQAVSSKYRPSMMGMDESLELTSSPYKTQGLFMECYASFGGMFGKLQYNIGLKGRMNRIEFTDLEQQMDNKNNQLAITPTVQLMFPLGIKSQKHSLLFTYKRVLNDIPYSVISSVSSWIDPYNYVTGNPDLVAPSSDLIMLGVQLFRNKLMFTGMYSRVHNKIYWQTFKDVNKENVFFTKPINLSGQNFWGAGVEWNENPTKWWHFKLLGRFDLRPEDVSLDGRDFKGSHIKWYFSLINDFNLSKGWGGYLNADYEPKYHSYDRIYHDVYSIGGQVYRSMLKGKLQLAFDFVALGQRRQMERQLSMGTITRKDITSVQRMGITVVWKFSGGKKVKVNVVDRIQEYHEMKDE